ncbi:MAG: thiamine phosphate synthase [Verrucomicrobiota bacterium]
MKRLVDCHLYAILDLSYVDISNSNRVAELLIDGGVDLIQLRGKKVNLETLSRVAADLHPISSRAGLPLIINDHPEIAASVSLEGVHVGQDDLSIHEVRQKVDRACLVGKSTHSVDQAIAAQVEGADYIGFGPLFATPTKPNYSPIGLDHIAEVHEKVRLPIFCIGGIKLDNLRDVIAAGARRVVIVSGLLQPPSIAAAAQSAKQLLTAA